MITSILKVSQFGLLSDTYVPCSAMSKTHKGPFKYYVIKEVGGWGDQMMMFDDKVGGWGWLNAYVSKNIQGKKLCLRAQKKRLEFSLKNLLEIYLSFRGYH